MNRYRFLFAVVAAIALGTVAFVTLICLSEMARPAPVNVSIIAINDFHGHLFPSQELNGRPAGSAPVLAPYIHQAMENPDRGLTLLALTGDTVGASPRATALLMDEPTILFFNTFADRELCSTGSGRCNVISVPGNHEFNRGIGELFRVLRGGNGDIVIPRLADPYPGFLADTVCANVVWKENGTPLLAPYTIRYAGNVPIAFIGATTTETPILELPQNLAGVEFLDEAASVNHYVRTLQESGIHAFVVLLHEGGDQDPYDGPTRDGCNVTGPVVNITASLDRDVDIVLAAHKHGFTNAFVPNSGGSDVLVVQAHAYGVAFADVDLKVDPVSGEVVEKTAQIVPAYADCPPGTNPDPSIETFLADIENKVSELENEVITVAEHAITRQPDDSGESTLGDLVADSQRAAMGADMALAVTGNNPGMIQADLPGGIITWADLEAVLPADTSIAREYGGWYSRPRVAVRNLTGEELRKILERQWEVSSPAESLSVSGVTYRWDPTLPAGSRITEILVNGTPLQTGATYRAAMNYYLAYGMGGNFSPAWDWNVTVSVGPPDIDALITYIRALPVPLVVRTDGRVTRSD